MILSVGRSVTLRLVVGLSLACVAGLGCKNNNNGNGTMGSTAYGGARGGALDVAPAPLTPVAAAPAPAPQAYAPAPASAQPVQPITYDTVPTGTSGNAAPAPVAASTSGAAASGSYTVKKGDTLYSIAKTHYGTGKDVNKIVAANPGVSPNTLKVGQKIVLP